MTTCDRTGCTLPAAWLRWKTDPSKRGANMNEPGMSEERLCHAHASEVRMYVGGRIEPLADAADLPAPPDGTCERCRDDEAEGDGLCPGCREEVEEVEEEVQAKLPGCPHCSRGCRRCLMC